MGSNLRAPFVLTQAMAGQGLMPEVDAGGEPRARGLIVNMLDQRVRNLTPEYTTYTIAKMGLWAMTRTTAQALAPAIRVNGIGPGPTLQGTHQDAEDFAAQRRGTVLGRGQIQRISRRHWAISSIRRASQGSLSAPMAANICSGIQALKAPETDGHAGSFAPR